MDSGKYDFKSFKSPVKRVPDCSHKYDYPVYAARDKHYRTVKEIMHEEREQEKYDLIGRLREHCDTFVLIGKGAVIAMILIPMVYFIAIVIVKFWNL